MRTKDLIWVPQDSKVVDLLSYTIVSTPLRLRFYEEKKKTLMDSQEQEPTWHRERGRKVDPVAMSRQVLGKGADNTHLEEMVTLSGLKKKCDLQKDYATVNSWTAWVHLYVDFPY